MRITCPNCQAKYEVGPDMIPTEGRDVQCSNCSTTWFQEGRGREALPTGERPIRRPSRPLPRDEAEANAAARARPKRPVPDAETLDILREERELAERMRRGGTETATGVPDAEVVADDPRAAAAIERSRLGTAAERARTRRLSTALPETEDDQSDDDIASVIAATLREANPQTAPDPKPDVAASPAMDDVAAAAAPLSARAARKELLPDIEEINSSLRPDERAAEAAAQAGEDADTEEAEPRAKKMSGFRTGFLLVFLIIVILIAVYIFAGRISAAVPQLADILTNYVAWVDLKRVALASGVEALTDSISPDP